MTDWLDKLRDTAAEVEAEPPPRTEKPRPDGDGPDGPKSANLRSDEHIAYLNTMTTVRVLFNDGSETEALLTPTGLDEVLAAHMAARRKK